MKLKIAKEKRFEVVYNEFNPLVTTQILVDKQTVVNYLRHTEGYGGGLTVLLDKDGKPVVTPVDS